LIKRIIAASAIVLSTFTLAACGSNVSDANVASENLSIAAEQFELVRRIVFVNGITNEYLFTIEGRCSLYDDGNQLEVTCKTAGGEFKKHFLGLSDNVTYIAEQIEGANVSVDHYRVIFKPSVIIPDVDMVN